MTALAAMTVPVPIATPGPITAPGLDDRAVFEHARRIEMSARGEMPVSPVIGSGRAAAGIEQPADQREGVLRRWRDQHGDAGAAPARRVRACTARRRPSARRAAPRCACPRRRRACPRRPPTAEAMPLTMTVGHAPGRRARRRSARRSLPTESGREGAKKTGSVIRASSSGPCRPGSIARADPRTLIADRI